MTTWEKNNGYPEKLKALKERLKAVPQLPGVYLFKIGRASCRERVSTIV